MTSAPIERFRLPEAGEARVPPEARGLARDQVRLAVVTPDGTRHLRADALPHLLQPGDLLVVNTSATLPAAVEFEHRGCPATLHVSTQLDDRSWVVELRRGDGTGPDAPRPGQVLRLPGGVRLRRGRAAPGGSGATVAGSTATQGRHRRLPSPARPTDPLPVHRGRVAARHPPERVRRPARQRGDGQRRPAAHRARSGPVDGPGRTGRAGDPPHRRGEPGVPRAAATGAVHRAGGDRPARQRHPDGRAAGRRGRHHGGPRPRVGRGRRSGAPDHRVDVPGPRTGAPRDRRTRVADRFARAGGQPPRPARCGCWTHPGEPRLRSITDDEAPGYLWHEFGDSMLLLP